MGTAGFDGNSKVIRFVPHGSFADVDEFIVDNDSVTGTLDVSTLSALGGQFRAEATRT